MELVRNAVDSAEDVFFFFRVLKIEAHHSDLSDRVCPPRGRLLPNRPGDSASGVLRALLLKG